MAEQSTGSQFLKPAVLSLAFGVFFALFVSSLPVPAMYLSGMTGGSGVMQERTAGWRDAGQAHRAVS